MLESDRIKRLQTRVVYTSYLIEKDAISKGAFRKLNITSGVFSENIAPGPTVFTIEELNFITNFQSKLNSINNPPDIQLNAINNPPDIQLNSINNPPDIQLNSINNPPDIQLNAINNPPEAINNPPEAINNPPEAISEISENYMIPESPNLLELPYQPEVSLDLIDNTINSEDSELTHVSRPTNVRAVPDDSRASVYWNPPKTPPLFYTVTSNPDAISTSTLGDETTATVIDLTNGIPYTFTVVARNPFGISEPSLPSKPIVPGVAPSFEISE